MKRLSILLFLFLTTSLFGFEIGLESGVSFFRYAEVSPNNKDDLYSIKSALVGLSVEIPIDDFRVGVSAAAQLPYEMTFTDALGTDDKNYVEDFFYYGLDSRVSLGYGFVSTGQFNLDTNLFVNFDFFYFQDNIIEEGTEYIFSIIGFGPEVDLGYSFSDSFGLKLRGSYSFNFLPIYSRTGDFLWSDNIMISLSGVCRL